MGTVTTEMKTASTTVDDEPMVVSVPVQVGPADELVTAEAIAEALDPALVSRLAAQARAQGVQLLGRGGILQQLTKRFLEAALEAGRFSAEAEDLRLYRRIATVDASAPLPQLEDQHPAWAEASSLARSWGLNQLADRLAALA